VDRRLLTAKRLDPAGKQLRIGLQLGALPDGRYDLLVTVADRAPMANAVTQRIQFATAAIITNGSFEEADASGAPTGWNVGPWSSDAATKFESAVKPAGPEGGKALCITGIAGALNVVCSQPTKLLKGGVAYLYTGRYKSAGGAALSVIANQDGQELDYLSYDLPAAADWAPFTWEFTLHGNDQAIVAARTGAVGESWFDDLKIVPKR